MMKRFSYRVLSQPSIMTILFNRFEIHFSLHHNDTGTIKTNVLCILSNFFQIITDANMSGELQQYTSFASTKELTNTNEVYDIRLKKIEEKYDSIMQMMRRDEKLCKNDNTRYRAKAGSFHSTNSQQLGGNISNQSFTHTIRKDMNNEQISGDSHVIDMFTGNRNYSIYV